eukprot:TRINITY_DN878_c0_g1_i1.p1 TRINITY_DN878_c0_g1~~TRINITY_DN878_c0_g1_i1.p1  ORF type:complete len:371 (-),score=85.92 TRINITY_DN878_c0_g1_i1:46-1158(-)
MRTVWLVFILLALSCASALVIDSYSVESNSSQVTILDHITALFGPGVGTYSVSGLAYLHQDVDGCKLDSLISSDLDTVKDKIVMFPRGNCNFIDKVMNAQLAGAIGVVIGNNDAEHPDWLVFMTAGGAANGDTAAAVNVTIPTVMVSYNSFKQIVSLQQASGVVLSISLDSRGEVSKVSDGQDASDVFTAMIRVLIVAIAGYPSLLMCMVCGMYVRVLIQRCSDGRRRRNRIADFPTVKYDADKNQNKGDPEFIHNTNCVICWDEFIDGQRIRVLPCAHGFCANCIESWLSDRSDLCPICKRSVFLADEQYERSCCGFGPRRLRRTPSGGAAAGAASYSQVHVLADDEDNSRNFVIDEDVEMQRIESEDM